MKKRILSSLLAFVMLLSALPMGVYAAETRYSVAASPDQTTDVGKTVSMSVSASGGKYNAYDLVLTYDTARLTYVSGQAADKGASVTEKSGSIRVIGYGADKSASTKVVTLTFKTKAAGTAKVVISSAKIDTGTNAPTKNAPPAAISRNTTKFTIQPGYTVTLDEGLALCGVDERITPCIDFGHLNARTLGGIQTKADYAAILDRMAEVLGDDRARQFHVHFSRIEYSAGGEKRHWTFADTQFGPEPQPLMELLAERQLTPVVICESAGTQAEDAQTMQQMYRAARNV